MSIPATTWTRASSHSMRPRKAARASRPSADGSSRPGTRAIATPTPVKRRWWSPTAASSGLAITPDSGRLLAKSSPNARSMRFEWMRAVPNWSAKR